MRGRVLQALAVTLVATAALADDAAARRGPLAWRDEFLLAQPMLTLPPASPDLPASGRTELRLQGDWGNDFGLETGPGGRARDLRLLVDGEHRSLAVSARRGIGGRTALGVRAGVQWRGGGGLDQIIDPFHDAFGFPDSGRPLYPRNRLAVEGRHRDGSPIAWTGRAGTGLLPVEIEVARSLARRGRRAVAAIARVRLPTASGPFASSGSGAALQITAAHGLGERADAYAGAGVTAFGPPSYQGLSYRRTREHGFLAFEWRPGRPVSLVAQMEAAGRLVRDVDGYGGLQLALRLGAAVGAGRWTVAGGFVEGLKDLDNTTDFGVFLGLSREF